MNDGYDCVMKCEALEGCIEASKLAALEVFLCIFGMISRCWRLGFHGTVISMR